MFILAIFAFMLFGSFGIFLITEGDLWLGIASISLGFIILSIAIYNYRNRQKKKKKNDDDTCAGEVCGNTNCGGGLFKDCGDGDCGNGCDCTP